MARAATRTSPATPCARNRGPTRYNKGNTLKHKVKGQRQLALRWRGRSMDALHHFPPAYALSHLIPLAVPVAGVLAVWLGIRLAID